MVVGSRVGLHGGVCLLVEVLHMHVCGQLHHFVSAEPSQPLFDLLCTFELVMQQLDFAFVSEGM